MCGIVGIASNGPVTFQMKEFFQQLLLVDVVRGPHATGVAAIDTLDRSLVVHKKALPSPVFLDDKEAMEGLFATKHNFNIYIGHNRFATRGAKEKDENAHPFIHGDIVGVHNGSLNDQDLLTNSKDFDVDSDNLYYHMNKHGLDDTLQKTNGAFALVWYDRKDNTLNFIRNDERPLAIGRLSNGCWVWASEMGMLKWLVSRHKTLSWATYEENNIKYNHVFSLEKNTHLKIEYKMRVSETPRATPKVLPVFPTQNYYGNGGYQGGFRSWGYDSGDDNRGNRGSSTVMHQTVYQKDVQARLDQFIIGGKVGESILQVEFLGHVKERTSGGYEANLSLFKYQSKNGKVVICHAFNHNACLTRDWTDNDIGVKVWGKISTIPAASSGTYKCTLNEELGFALSLSDLTETKPNKYYPFCEKKEGEDDNVLPFRGGKTQQAPATTGSQGSKGSEHSGSDTPLLSEEDAAAKIQEILNRHELLENGTLVEGVEKGKEVRVLGPLERVLVLANATCTQEEFQEMVNEGGGHCSNCCSRMGNIGVSRLWLHEYFDRGEGLTHYLLSCSEKCHKITVSIMEELDAEYDKYYGGSDV